MTEENTPKFNPPRLKRHVAPSDSDSGTSSGSEIVITAVSTPSENSGTSTPPFLSRPGALNARPGGGVFAGARLPPGASSSSGAAGSSGFSPAEAKNSLLTPATLIIEGIYLGSQGNAAGKAKLRTMGVSYILDLKERQTDTEDSHPDFHILAVPMSDHGHTSIREVLTECFNFIDKARQGGNTILVHCRGGVNRSATILLAYLMKTEKLTLKQAWDLVHGQRPMVQPVQDYMQQLHQYELELYGVATMAPQEVGESNSLTNRIAQWRDSKKVKGSTPADLASNRSSEGSPLEGDSATRSATAPSVGGSSSPIVNLTGALSGASSTTGTSSADTAETCPDSDLKLTPSESSVGAK